MSAGLDQALASIEGVEGWLSDTQARKLYDRARAVASGGAILEIGSYRGRSTIVLANACEATVTVFAVDPHAGTDRGPQQIHGSPDDGEADRTAFQANLRRAGLAGRVTHVRLPSAQAFAAIEGGLDLLYIDGAHRYRPARGDLETWGARVRPGGTMLVHDSFSSIGVTLAILRRLAFGIDFAYVGRTSSLAEYRRVSVPLRGGARAQNALRQLAQLPWFTRNLAIKSALVLRLPRLAHWLGHDRALAWPF